MRNLDSVLDLRQLQKERNLLKAEEFIHSPADFQDRVERLREVLPLARSDEEISAEAIVSAVEVCLRIATDLLEEANKVLQVAEEQVVEETGEELPDLHQVSLNRLVRLGSLFTELGVEADLDGSEVAKLFDGKVEGTRVVLAFKR